MAMKGTAATLSEDLISEILVRLPAISVMRCRCVCKAWFDLIKTPNFIDMHLKHSSTKQAHILLNRNNDYLTDTLSIHAYESFDYIHTTPLDSFSKICGPCNGLICVLDNLDIDFLLFNPSIGESGRAPPSPFPCQKGWKYDVKGFGLGFVSNPNDYKIIAFVSFYYVPSSDDENEDNVHHRYAGDERPADKVEIYDMSTDAWREIDCDCPYRIIKDEGTLFNGSLHWIALREGIRIIACFNMSTEVFRDMELPNDRLEKDGIMYSLMVLNDSLALFAFTSYYHNSKEQFVDVWVMREYGVTESWTKQVSVGPLSGIKQPLMLWKNEAIFLESAEGQLLSCALDNHEIKEFEIQSDRGSMTVLPYQESLIPVDIDIEGLRD